MSAHTSSPLVAVVSRAARGWVVAAAFLGWLFAGVQMSMTSLVSLSATTDFVGQPVGDGDARKVAPSQVLTTWFARYNATFLFGAAAGGLLFGWFGDRFGRAKALGLSVCCYSLFSGVAGFAHTPEQFVLLRFLGCLGIGGTWPNGIALAAETWAEVSRPLLAGVIGAAANVGLVLMGLLACYVQITPESWRWALWMGAAPFVVGVFTLLVVPESPAWLANRASARGGAAAKPVREVFRPPLLTVTLLGIALGIIPLFGGWGCTNWLIPWADQVGAQADPSLKGWTQVYRSSGATASSLLGGWVAHKIGRRGAYFLFSLMSLAIGQYIYQFLDPRHAQFGWAVFLFGTATGFYFGWLPLCLPEMFPTRVRSTGSGVTFNAGRIATALGVLGTGYLSSLPYFHGDYGKLGSVTSLVFVLGLIVPWLIPREPRRIEA